MIGSINITIAVLAALIGLIAGAGIMLVIGITQTRQTLRRQKSDAAHLAKLRLAKEKFDYENLLKVIEHERKQLADLRVRELQSTEEMRRAMKAADDANRSKSAFLAVISHEIRTPMTGVLGMVKVLQDTTMTKEQHDYVATIKESGNAMMSLLNDILDFEKIESGRVQLEMVDFDLPRLIQTIATLMQGHASNKGIELKVEVDEALPRFVVGDMARLRQVILNLVSNAIKFTGEGGVTIRLNLSEAPKDEDKIPIYQIYFAVQDTGIGIPVDSQEHIFNPFAQADKTINRKYGGTGLGLAISKRLIEAMGSQINLTSREGAGTTFFFTLALPRGSAARVAEIPTAPIIQTTSNENKNAHDILAVEDNEINRRVLKTLIEARGHRATLCASGREALNILKSGQRFHLILTDIQMDGMSGLELVPHIRALPNGKNVTIFALTGNVDTADIKACLDAGMNGHLSKPIDPHAFDEVMSAMEQNTLAKKSAPAPTLTTKQPAPSLVTHDSSLTIQPELDETSSLQLHLDDQEAAATYRAPKMQNINDITQTNTVASTFQSDTLDTLKESLGKDQLGSILQGLFDKANEIINVLKVLPQPYDLETIRARAHELKGMTGNFGLMALSQLAQQIERKAKDKESVALPDLIARLPATYQEGRQAIEDWANT